MRHLPLLVSAGLLSAAFGVGIALLWAGVMKRPVDPGFLLRTAIVAVVVVVPAVVIWRNRQGKPGGR